MAKNPLHSVLLHPTPDYTRLFLYILYSYTLHSCIRVEAKNPLHSVFSHPTMLHSSLSVYSVFLHPTFLYQGRALVAGLRGVVHEESDDDEEGGGGGSEAVRQVCRV